MSLFHLIVVGHRTKRSAAYVTYTVAGCHISSGLDERPDGIYSLFWYLGEKRNTTSAIALEKIGHVETH